VVDTDTPTRKQKTPRIIVILSVCMIWLITDMVLAYYPPVKHATNCATPRYAVSKWYSSTDRACLQAFLL